MTNIPASNRPAQDFQWRNQPQSNAMASGVMIFMAGGMESAFGLGWGQNIGRMTELQYSWFIGFIVGAIIAAPLIPHLPTKYYLLISAIMVLSSGIIYLTLPYESYAILIARYISGFGIGFSIVAFIVHGGEIADPSYRGSVLALEQYAFSFGIAIQVIYASQWPQHINFAANRLHGIFIIIFAVLTLASLIFVIESPIFYLRKSNEKKALDSLRLLQRPAILTNSTKTVLEDLKDYVKQEMNQTIGENIHKAIYPFIKVLLYRCMVAFSFSIVLSFTIIFASFFSMGFTHSWQLIIFPLLRVFGTFLSLWLVDNYGRKLIGLFSLLCMGGFTIGVGIIFRNEYNVTNVREMSIVCTLMLISQIFAGLFIPSTSIYLGEAFPLALKPYLIAICVSMEQVIQIIGILTFDISIRSVYAYCITTGIIMCSFFIFFCLTIPETRNTTLSDAQKRFRKLLYLKIY